MALPKETDLYPHLKAWLVDQGYDVHAEVRGCDIAASRDGRLVLVEIKRAVTLDLVLQIIRRQEASALVYGAVPAPRDFSGRKWREQVRLLRRLNAGLIIVYLGESPRVEPLFHPHRLAHTIRKSLARSYLDEMAARTVDVNLGGSPGWESMNGFREKGLRIAVAIERFGPSSKHLLTLTGASSMTGSILRRNRDGWFTTVRPGVYDLSTKGREALRKHKELAEVLRIQCRQIPTPHLP
ncbi:MAG: DUF2161 family putative PD-(D/E)XK-type phosphodiesterase [Planctomycetaceae bacterium]|nr:DUF2161 family putative PD-(D/E)XK-type phosphodiesterase [Planctomycetaceae bacterium]